jgi:hypothetical protein
VVRIVGCRFQDGSDNSHPSTFVLEIVTASSCIVVNGLRCAPEIGKVCGCIFGRMGLEERTWERELDGVDFLESRLYGLLAGRCKPKGSRICTFKPIGITPILIASTSVFVKSLTIAGSTTLTSGWHNFSGGFAYLSWLNTLRVGLGER